MEITKIVITGGPCGGKTTALSWIQNHFVSKGYTVLFVPETATELISGGVAPWTCGTNLEYQICQCRLQLAKEQIFEDAARTMHKDRVLIVCDRGFMDNRAYMNDEEFAQVLSHLNLNEIWARDHYDAVFHLVTAADGAEDAYTTANNAARYESVEQAIAVDRKLIASWTGHPHLRVIDNSSGFYEKMKRLIGEIDSFLGEPVPYEIERKFLISYPDLQWLENNPHCHKVEIVQTYLTSNEGEERRVRQRGERGNFIYFETTKRHLNPRKRIEIERRLSEEEYLSRLQEADKERHPLRKTRYCLTYDNQYFEIDIYPFWNDRATAEIELRDEETPIRFPKELHILREVTGDPEYKNANLAKL